MPKPKPNESQEDFVARCIPIVLNDETAQDQKQAVAICNSMWQDAEKQMIPHKRLLKLVQGRTEKHTEFNNGILTADCYVKRFLDEIGIQSCYRHMCRTSGVWASFNDVMEKAAGTLSYISPTMEVKKKGNDVLPSSIERPKNTLMVFRHVLTTSTKDRDGDILRTKGAKPDPKMLLLWQHVHTLPIGKMIAVAEHTADELQLYSCIIDMNELCHDAAMMVDNGMGRFSHGFRALDFLEIKEGGETPGGFDVKEFEIMEESLVSVPANPDAKTEEVLLSLVEGGKLTSPLMKDYGLAIRGRRPLSIPVELDVKLSINSQEVKSNAVESRNKEGSEEGTKAGSSEKAEADAGDVRGEKKSTEDAKVKAEEVENKESKAEQGSEKQVAGDPASDKAKADSEEQEMGEVKDSVCPECGYAGPGKDGKCPECGTKLIQKKDVTIKVGRTLSKANERKIRDVVEDLKEASRVDGLTRGCKALLVQATRSLETVIESLGSDNGTGKDARKLEVRQALAVVLASGGEKERKILASVFKAIEDGLRDDATIEQFSELLASS